MLKLELDTDQQSGYWGLWRKDLDEWNLISQLYKYRYHAMEFAAINSWKYEMKVDPNQTVHFRNGDGTYEYVELWDNQYTCTCLEWKQRRSCRHSRTVRNGGYVIVNQTKPEPLNFKQLQSEQADYVYRHLSQSR